MLSYNKLNWRPRRESNPRTRICSPLRSHSATRPRHRATRLESAHAPADPLHIATRRAIRKNPLARTRRQSLGIRAQMRPSLAMDSMRRTAATPAPGHFFAGTTHPIYANRARLVISRACKAWSLIAQLVERSTVNRMVAGSSPAQGAKPLRVQPNFPDMPRFVQVDEIAGRTIGPDYRAGKSAGARLFLVPPPARRTVSNTAANAATVTANCSRPCRACGRKRPQARNHKLPSEK